MHNNPVHEGSATGPDSTVERIVSTEVWGNFAHIHRRAGDILRRDTTPYTPWFITSDPTLLKGIDAGGYDVMELNGKGPYRHLVRLHHGPAVMGHLKRVLRDRSGAEPGFPWKDPRIVRLGRAEQFLVQTGIRFFQGLNYGDLHRLQFDLETTGLSPQTGQLFMIAISDSRGYERVLDTQEKSEAELIREFVRIVRERNPDVIEGHNLFGFDFPFLHARARFLDVGLGLGRRGEEISSFKTACKIAELMKEIEYWNVPGREVLDTYLASERYDAAARDLENHKLKTVARHFGVAPADRTYIEGAETFRIFQQDPARVKAYALDDVREVRALSPILFAADFEITKHVPFPLSRVALSGTARLIDLLLIADYVTSGTALPAPPEKKGTFEGGRVELFQRGFIRNIVKADVESLYPSLMLNHKIAPASDERGTFLRLLDEFTGERLKEKAAARAAPAGSPEGHTHEGRNQAFKRLINSFYGYLGTGWNYFSDPVAAARVTEEGRKVLGTLCDAVRKHGGNLIEADTDGVYFTPPPAWAQRDRHSGFVEESLARELRGDLRLAHDGSWPSMLSLGKKNYALLETDGTVTLKGASLRARDREPFFRKFLKDSLATLLKGDVQGVREVWLATLSSLRKEGIPVEDLAKRSTLTMDLSQYKSEHSAKLPAYEAALDSGRTDARAGDRVTFYRVNPLLGRSPWRVIEGYSNDADVDYYVRRLRSAAEILRPAFKEADFALVFAEDAVPVEVVQNVVTCCTQAPAPVVPGLRGWRELCWGAKGPGAKVRRWIEADDTEAQEEFFAKYEHTGVFETILTHWTRNGPPRGREDKNFVLEGGPCWLEFEKDATRAGIDLALAASRAGADYLTEAFGIPPEVIRRVYNGRKSFWLYVPQAVFGIERVVGLHAFYEKVARDVMSHLPGELAGCVDLHLYDFRRLHRPVGVRYPGAGWSIELGVDSHRGDPFDAILDRSLKEGVNVGR